MNNRKRKLSWFMLAWFSILSLNLFACMATPFSFAKVTPLTSTSMVIYGSMIRDYSGKYGVLDIGVGEVTSTETVTAASKQEGAGLTATLWLVIEERPETYTSVQVRTGQTVNFEGYEIKVLRVAKDSVGFSFVDVEVAETK